MIKIKAAAWFATLAKSKIDIFSNLKIKYKLFIGFLLLIIFFGLSSLFVEPRILSRNMEAEINKRINDAINISFNVLEDTKHESLFYANLVSFSNDVRQEMAWENKAEIIKHSLRLTRILSVQAQRADARDRIALEIVPARDYLDDGKTIRAVITEPINHYLEKKTVYAVQDLIAKRLIAENVQIQANNNLLAIIAVSPIDKAIPGSLDVESRQFSGAVIITSIIDNKFVYRMQQKISDEIQFTIYKINKNTGRAISIATTVTDENGQAITGKFLPQKTVTTIKRLSNNEKVFIANATLNKTPYRMGYKTLLGEDGAIGLLEVAIPTEKLIKAVKRTKDQIYLMAALGIFLSLIVIWLISHNVNKPLAQLVAGTEALAKGEFGQRIDVSSKDELGFLAEKFNWMTENIERQQKELLKYQVELVRQQDELVKKEKLAALGNFMATIIHDLNNPLAAISWHAELLTQDELEKEEQKACAHTIIEQIKRLKEMTYEVLQFAKGTIKLEKKPYYLAVLMEDIFGFLEKSFSKDNIEVKLKQGFYGQVNVDITKMRRVFYNLATNAKDAMPLGGKLTIETSDRKDHVEITITDTGKGMSADVKQNLFKPFYTHGKQIGIGLGLSITQKIIEEHGGRIGVESTEGVGTMFTICIPIENNLKNENIAS